MTDTLSQERVAEIRARVGGHIPQFVAGGVVTAVLYSDVVPVLQDRRALLVSHEALRAEVERLRGQLLVCREAGKMLSGALISSEDQREAALDRIWDSINAHGGTFEADDLEGNGKCEMIDKALAIIEKEGGVGEVQRLSLKTKEEADDE